MSLFKTYKAVIFENGSDAPVVSNANLVVKRITPENVQDGLSFNDQNTIEDFNYFLTNEQRGYYCYLEDQCIMRGWAFHMKERARVGQDFIFQLKENDLFIAWLETNPSKRRLGAMSSMLNFIYTTESNDHRLLAYVDAKNSASIQGFMKAGFSATSKYKCFVFWKLKWYIQTETNGRRSFRLKFGDQINP